MQQRRNKIVSAKQIQQENRRQQNNGDVRKAHRWKKRNEAKIANRSKEWSVRWRCEQNARLFPNQQIQQPPDAQQCTEWKRDLHWQRGETKTDNWENKKERARSGELYPLWRKKEKSKQI